MTDITEAKRIALATIPPEAVEAAAEDLFHMQYGDSKGSWSDAPEWLKVTIRSEARAACLAMLRSWPGMSRVHRDWDGTALVCLPLPQENSNAEG